MPDLDDCAPVREQLINEARDLICATRNKEYGEPSDNFGRIADYWTSYLHHRYNANFILAPEDVALLMVLCKIARLHHSSHRDGFVDIIGYAAIAGELA